MVLAWSRSRGGRIGTRRPAGEDGVIRFNYRDRLPPFFSPILLLSLPTFAPVARLLLGRLSDLVKAGRSARTGSSPGVG